MSRGRRLLVQIGLGLMVVLMTAGHGRAGVTASVDPEEGVDAHGLTLVATASPQELDDPLPNEPTFPGRRDQLGDIAFWGNTAVMFDGQLGAASGFRVLDVSDPTRPKVLGGETRKGNTTHIAIWRHLVIISVDNLTPGYAENNSDGFQGLMVYSIKDPNNPEWLGKVTTSHAHTFTVLPDLKHNRLLAYVAEDPTLGEEPTIDLVEIPLNKPGDLRELSPVSVAPLEGNHDVTVFAPQQRAVVLDPVHGFLLWDISNPTEPETIGAVRTALHANANGNNNHSAAFSWDGQYLVISEEPAGGAVAPPTADQGEVPLGRLRFYRVQQIIDDYNKSSRLGGETAPLLGDFSVTPPVSTYSIPAARGDGESPFYPHQFNVLPIQPDRDTGTQLERILSIGWMRGGTSLIDFTDAHEPHEIGHWVTRGVEGLSTQTHSNTYTSLWYRDHIYAPNVAEDGLMSQFLVSHSGATALETTRPSRGLDVLTLADENGYPWAQRVADLPRLNYSLQEGAGIPQVQQVMTATEPSGAAVLKAVVRNTGYAITPTATVAFTLDGNKLGEVRAPALAPGHSATVTLPWTPPVDTDRRHLLTVSPVDRTAEGDGVETISVAVYGDQIAD